MVGIKFDITGDNKNFLAAIQSSVKGVEGGIAKIEDAGKRMEDLFTGLGQSLAIAGVGLTIEQIIQKIVTMRVELEKSMKEVGTLSPEIAQNLLKYTDAIDQMTTQIPIAANEGAKALYQIVSAGHDGAAGMNVLEVSAKAAIGGVTETVTAADAITTILNAYKMEGTQAEAVSDALFKTVKLGKTSFGELGATIAQVAPLASSYGIRIEEVLAVVASLTKQGTPTAQAMTQIRAAITGCSKSMGDAAFQGRTLQETFAAAMMEAKGSANTLKANMGTIEAVSAILGVTGKNAQGAAADLAEVNNAAGAAAEAFELMNDSGSNQFKLLSNNIIAYLAPLGDAIADTFGRGAKELNEAFADGRITETLKTVGGLLTAATAAYVTYNGAIAMHNAYQGISAVVTGLVNVQREYEIALLTAGGAMTRKQAAAIVGEISVRTVLTNAIKAQTVALMKNTAAMLTNPYVLLAGVVAGLSYAFYKLATAETEVERLQRNYQESLKSLEDRMDEQKRKTEELISIATDEEQSTLKRDSAIQQLIKTYPEIIQKYIDEEGHLTNILGLKKEIAGIEDNARMNGLENQYSSVKSQYEAQKKYVASATNVHPEDIEKLNELERQMNELKDKVDSGWVAKFRDEYKDLNDTELKAKVTELQLAVQKGMGMAWTDWVTSSNGALSTAVTRMMSTEATKKLADDLSSILAKRTKSKEDEVQNKEYWAAIKKDAEEKLEKMPDTAVNSKEWKELVAKIQEAEKHLKKYSVSSADAINALKQRDAYHRLEKQQELQHKRDMEDLAFDTRQAELDVQEEGLDKTLAQLKLNFDKQKAEIQRGYENLVTEKIEKARQLFEANPANKGMVFDESSVDASYTEEEVENFNARMKALLEGFKRDVRAVAEEERSAMLDYLKEYGTYQEKKKAIAEEYSNKIAKAVTEGEKKSLQEGLKNALSNLDLEEIKNGFNWSVLFGNLSALTKKELQNMKKMLDDFKKKGGLNNLNLVDKKEFEEKYRELENAINDKGGIFGGLVNACQEYETALTNLETAQKAYDKALEEGVEDVIEKTRKALMEAQGEVAKKRQSKSDAEDSSINKVKGLAGAINQLGNASEMSVSQIGETVASVTSLFGEAAGKIGGWIGAICAAVEILAHQDIDQVAKDLSSELWGAIGEAFDSKYSLLHYITPSLLGSSDSRLTKDIEELTKSNENLANRIDYLSSKMDDVATDKAASVYKEQLRLLSQSEKNTQEMMERSADAYSNGFLGIHGKKSSGHKINKGMKNAEWRRISSIVGHSVTNDEDFWKLSPEEMKKVYDEAYDIYAKIKELADDGYENAAQYMDDYIAFAEQREKLEKAYYEKLTGLSFDSLQSNFASKLKDMSTDAQTFADEFKEMMINAVIESLVSSKYKPLLDKWYKDYAKFMEDGSLSPYEQETLKRQWDDITRQALEERNSLAESMGWNNEDSTTAKQEASSKGFAAMSQEVGQELNGRFTAVQIASEKAANEVVLMTNQLSLLVSGFSAQCATTEEIRNLMLVSNSHLEDIARLTKKIYTDFATKLDNITDNTKNL